MVAFDSDLEEVVLVKAVPKARMVKETKAKAIPASAVVAATKSDRSATKSDRSAIKSDRSVTKSDRPVTKSDQSTTKSEQPAPGVLSSSSLEDTKANIPKFIEATYRNKFLPTLFSRFAASTNPWLVADNATDLVQVLQEIVDHCHPGNTYCVRWSDKLCMVVMHFSSTGIHYAETVLGS